MFFFSNLIRDIIFPNGYVVDNGELGRQISTFVEVC